MKTLIQIKKGESELKLQSPVGFSHLSLLSGRVSGNEDIDRNARIEMRLLSDTDVFTCYANIIAGTSNLSGMNLLATSSNIPILVNQTFHTLVCLIPRKFFGEDAEITLEFDMEPVAKINIV
jgi:hypothetical protein